MVPSLMEYTRGCVCQGHAQKQNQGEMCVCGVCVWVCVLHSHMICHLQAGAPGKPGVSFLRPENQGSRWCKPQSEV